MVQLTEAAGQVSLGVKAAEGVPMSKWRLLVGGVSLAQLAWGILALVEYARSVGGTGDLLAVWVYSGLGLGGLLVLAVPRAGFPMAFGQAAVAAYALWWCGLAVVLARAASATPVVPLAVPPLLMTMFGMLALLCGLNALGAWQVAPNPCSGEPDEVPDNEVNAPPGNPG